MTATRIIMGAASSRDWQPQHHDAHHARASGLSDIILNAPTQSGWLNRYLTDWAGPRARIGRLKFRMVKPIAAGDAISIQGSVGAAAESDQGWRWLRIALTIDAGDRVATDATALLAVPLARCPWRADSGAWHIPGWDLAGIGMRGVSV
jgi:acyl dehydratase